MDSETESDWEPSRTCLRVAGLVTSFHGGEAGLAELDLVFAQVPDCPR